MTKPGGEPNGSLRSQLFPVQLVVCHTHVCACVHMRTPTFRKKVINYKYQKDHFHLTIHTHFLEMICPGVVYFCLAMLLVAFLLTGEASFLIAPKKLTSRVLMPTVHGKPGRASSPA